MTKIITYKCDICRDVVKDPRDMFGVHFSNMVNFTLGGYGSTDGVHICYRCARQLREHLNNEQICKEMEVIQIDVAT